jgi:hypothetical protein
LTALAGIEISLPKAQGLTSRAISTTRRMLAQANRRGDRSIISDA